MTYDVRYRLNAIKINQLFYIMRAKKSRKKIFDRVTKQTKVREKVIDFCEVVTDTFLITENYFL